MIPADAHNAREAFHIWKEINKQAIESSILIQGKSARLGFKTADDYLSTLSQFSPHSAIYRKYAKYCFTQADLCNHRGDPYAEMMQYKFAKDFLVEILINNSKQFNNDDLRLMALAHSKIADAKVRQPQVYTLKDAMAEVYEAERIVGQIQVLNNNDRRFAAQCHYFLARYYRVLGDHSMANTNAELAIRAMIHILPSLRTEKDKTDLNDYRVFASSEEHQAKGCLSSLKHYGLFVSTSKSEAAHLENAPERMPVGPCRT